ncbi:protein FAR1-RELATED SEQUENCE 5-like [Lotus japonicus]|uniref:protein FAR1-RELATED SEQUENCE 5-like n=1 Tax=Lotus japonicus TaxID=34305 RepID=UPI00258D3036|nr:protein FAR1-RELATED SEQUENCE 5-like [Lotus japonicus]
MATIDEVEIEGARMETDTHDRSIDNGDFNNGDSNSEEGFDDDDHEVGLIQNMMGIAPESHTSVVDPANTIGIDGPEDMGNVDFRNLSREDLMKYHFVDREVAFTFYNWYARLRGFSARKSSLLRSKKGVPIQQTLVCYRQGQKEKRTVDVNRPRRRSRKDAWCGCQALCRVHIDYYSGRWYVIYINDSHNHSLVNDKHVGLLPCHRGMDDGDIVQMNKMRNAGIGNSKIYGTFATEMGGYDRVPFFKEDMHNEVQRERRKRPGDAKGVLAHFRQLKKSDPSLYWKHLANDDGRLLHLFWADGHNQRDYSIFGDVLAFDATYKKNKYKCPFVVFSGVNHHNQIIIFASVIVSNEKEDTYVWLLQQLLTAMKGKIPIYVITDGDPAM